MSSLAKRIKEAREALGLTRAGLAKKAQVTPAAVTQFERGTRKPSLPTLEKLSDALDVEVSYIMGKHFEPIEPQVLFRNLKGLSNEDRDLLMQIYNRLKRNNPRKKH